MKFKSSVFNYEKIDNYSNNFQYLKNDNIFNLCNI